MTPQELEHNQGTMNMSELSMKVPQNNLNLRGFVDGDSVKLAPIEQPLYFTTVDAGSLNGDSTLYLTGIFLKAGTPTAQVQIFRLSYTCVQSKGHTAT
jgi:hypothetical protein